MFIDCLPMGRQGSANVTVGFVMDLFVRSGTSVHDWCHPRAPARALELEPVQRAEQFQVPAASLQLDAERNPVKAQIEDPSLATAASDRPDDSANPALWTDSRRRPAWTSRAEGGKPNRIRYRQRPGRPAGSPAPEPDASL